MQTKPYAISVLASTKLPTKYGEFDCIVWKSAYDNKEHILLSCGTIQYMKDPILVRIHSQCATSETFLSMKCDCREQLHEAMRMIAKQGQGMIIYLHQEGRGIGLTNKIKAYHVQEKGFDTVEANEKLGFPADLRNYQSASDLLHHYKIQIIQLISNNPHKIKHLENAGITIANRISLHIKPHDVNKKYLQIKKEKLGHLLDHI